MSAERIGGFNWGTDPGGDLSTWWGMVARQDPSIAKIQQHRKECRENQVRNIARRKSDLAELRELREVLAEQMKVVRAAAHAILCRHLRSFIDLCVLRAEISTL